MWKTRILWALPVLNGIAIGLILWAAHGFDVRQVLGAWAFIAVVSIIYRVIIASIPIQEPHRKARRSMTPVQRRYTEAIQLDLAKRHS